MSWDVAIAGGGPAGAIAAYVLAQAGRRVVVVDRAGAHRAPRKIGESLPAMAGYLLAKLGLRALLDRGHRRAFGNVSAWGGDAIAVTDFIHDPQGLGWHLDRACFDADLRAAAQDAGAEIVAGTVRGARRRAPKDGGGWDLAVDRGEAVHAACVVDATGRRAAIAQAAGARRLKDDDLVALYTWAHAPPDQEEETRTLVESVPDGWWYTAPLPDGTRVVALHLDRDVARLVLRGTRAERDAAFRRRLAETRHVHALVGEATEPVRSTEACGGELDRAVGAGWIAVGDAALSFDPISAQGIFNALYTGMKAGDAVHAALDRDPSALVEYGRRIAEVRATYRARHAYIHDAERRWPDAPFWTRRRGVARLAG